MDLKTSDQPKADSSSQHRSPRQEPEILVPLIEHTPDGEGDKDSPGAGGSGKSPGRGWGWRWFGGGKEAEGATRLQDAGPEIPVLTAEGKTSPGLSPRSRSPIFQRCKWCSISLQLFLKHTKEVHVCD